MKAVCQFLIWAAAVGFLHSLALGRENRSTSTTKFFLYTRSNQSERQELVTGDLQTVTQSNFDANNPTKIIIHGWKQSAEKLPNPQLRSAYLDTGEYNTISVDWEEYAALDYIPSRYKVSKVGADVAAFIDFLNEYVDLSFDSLVVIGNSLGAHIAGFSGKFVARGRLPYIVGLDPAGPLFNYLNPNERLNSNDADYVETIQTNGGKFGFLEPLGSASFYPNWGRHQPGCGENLLEFCSHIRVVYLYADAIRGAKFSPVYRCESYLNIAIQRGCKTMNSSIDIGDPTQIPRENGIFYFTTGSKEPFEDE